MNKKDESNKNIIIGVGFFAIAIAIITAINFFSPISRAQVEKDEANKFALYMFDEAYDKEQMKEVADKQWSKGYCEVKNSAVKGAVKEAKFVAFEQFDVKEQNKSWDDKFDAADKADFTFASVKYKELNPFDWDKPVAQDDKPNFDVKFALDNGPQC